MRILLKKAYIIDENSPFHQQKKDLLIVDNTILKIADTIQEEKAEVLEYKHLHVSPGFIDMNCHIYDPGYEYREDIDSGLKAAKMGGYTGICYMPNTEPCIDTASQLEYVLKKSKDKSVHVYPVGAISKQCKGTDLAEIYDMYHSGAVAFSDGHNAVQSAGLMERALLYVKKIDGLIINHPENVEVSRKGSMNEGVVSTKMGIHAAPPLAEELMLARDIYLTEYTESRLHVMNISTQRSVDLIRQAKKKGIRITAGVNAYNLILEDASVSGFDTNYKVNPHLRTKEDIAALIEGLSDGTIDVICSGHDPKHLDEKKVEFELAEFGMIGLESCFSVARKATENTMDITQLIAVMAKNPREILRLDNVVVEEGSQAELVLYDPDIEYAFNLSDVYSKSKNTPFVGKKLKGKILNTIC